MAGKSGCQVSERRSCRRGTGRSTRAGWCRARRVRCTFRALQRGARQVVAIDDFSDYLGLLKPEERKAWGTFDLCREALGYDTTQCQREELSVYDGRLGRFDVVFFFGTLYHLRHPLLAL